MLKLEIAGQTITYRNALELSRRIQERLVAVRSRRSVVERECKLLRGQEKTLEQFLGGTQAPLEKPNEEEANG